MEARRSTHCRTNGPALPAFAVAGGWLRVVAVRCDPQIAIPSDVDGDKDQTTR